MNPPSRPTARTKRRRRNRRPSSLADARPAHAAALGAPPARVRGSMSNTKFKWTVEEESALRDGVAKYGPGKWRLILSDPTLAASLRARSNVDLKDKWRNLHGGEARSESPSLVTTGGGNGREASSSGRDGTKRRREGEEEDDDGVAASVGRVPNGAHEAQVNEMMSEVQRAKREAESALAQLVAAERVAESAEREAWEAEKLASELVTEAQRQKVGLPVEGAEDVADVAASLLGENSGASPPG